MTEELGQNAFVVRVQPDEGVTMRFGSKVPGNQMEVRDVTMDFGYGTAFTEASPEAYERLILDVLLGEPSLFPRQRGGRAVLGDPRPGAGALGGAGARPRPLSGGLVGPGFGQGHARSYGTHVEAAMIVDLPSSTVSDINKALFTPSEIRRISTWVVGVPLPG